MNSPRLFKKYARCWTVNNNSIVLLILDSHTPKVKIMSDKTLAESAVEGLGKRGPWRITAEEFHI